MDSSRLGAGGTEGAPSALPSSDDVILREEKEVLLSLLDPPPRMPKGEKGAREETAAGRVLRFAAKVAIGKDVADEAPRFTNACAAVGRNAETVRTEIIYDSVPRIITFTNKPSFFYLPIFFPKGEQKKRRR